MEEILVKISTQTRPTKEEGGDVKRLFLRNVFRVAKLHYTDQMVNNIIFAYTYCDVKPTEYEIDQCRCNPYEFLMRRRDLIGKQKWNEQTKMIFLARMVYEMNIISLERVMEDLGLTQWDRYAHSHVNYMLDELTKSHFELHDVYDFFDFITVEDEQSEETDYDYVGKEIVREMIILEEQRLKGNPFATVSDIYMLKHAQETPMIGRVHTVIKVVEAPSNLTIVRKHRGCVYHHEHYGVIEIDGFLIYSELDRAVTDVHFLRSIYESHFAWLIKNNPKFDTSKPVIEVTWYEESVEDQEITKEEGEKQEEIGLIPMDDLEHEIIMKKTPLKATWEIFVAQDQPSLRDKLGKDYGKIPTFWKTMGNWITIPDDIFIKLLKMSDNVPAMLFLNLKYKQKLERHVQKSMTKKDRFRKFQLSMDDCYFGRKRTRLI
jgi:hypothetical protein